MPLLRLHGHKHGSWLYCDSDNYIYRKGYTHKDKIILRCHKRGCLGSAIAPLDEEKQDDYVTRKNEHTSCEPDSKFKIRMEARSQMITLAENQPLMPAHEVYTVISARYKNDVLTHPATSFPAVESTIRRRRRSSRPQMPDTIDELSILLESTQFGKTATDEPFYRKMESGLWGTNLYFVYDDVLCYLKNDTILHIDTTFKTVPDVLGLTRLFSILIVMQGYIFPVLQVLMTKTSLEAYRYALQYLKSLSAEMFIPQLIISDFESSVLTAIKDEFPFTTTEGCWFHYCQAVVQKVRSLDLQKSFRQGKVKSLYGYLLVLPFLPPERITAGMKFIEEQIESNELKELVPVVAYIQTTWLNEVGVDALSVHNDHKRTDNLKESYHSYLTRILHVRPSLWDFFEYIRKFQRKVVFAVEAVQKCSPSKQFVCKPKYIVPSTSVRNANLKLQRGLIKEGQFLYSLAQRVDNLIGCDFSVYDNIEIEEKMQAPCPAENCLIEPNDIAGEVVLELDQINGSINDSEAVQHIIVNDNGETMEDVEHAEIIAIYVGDYIAEQEQISEPVKRSKKRKKMKVLKLESCKTTS